ncbi:hypothetical protein [Salipiger mangrovisoli]|uniref:Uncharacterized protein n=1 Tax=Salipiger mangrovisoli TaxID=2865933 RepID=A0ABR9WVS0_9RHOB|nr:hypothetical protein [Salipiger mangrovisoli]MBE9635365.1 hypothetical protein [Salipiger mangrovisoli]
MRQAILIVGAIVLLGVLVFGMRGGQEPVPAPMENAGAEADAAAESAGDTLERAADDAAAAGREAMDQAGEAAGTAMDAISDAAGKAAETVEGAAEAVSDVAKDAMASAEGAVEEAHAAADAAAQNAAGTGAEVARLSDEELRELFTVEGFDYDRAVAYIEQSDLGFAAKEATKSALASVKDAPDQLAAVLEEARERLGL